MSIRLISDELWAIVEPLLPAERPEPKGGRPAVPLLEAVQCFRHGAGPPLGGICQLPCPVGARPGCLRPDRQRQPLLLCQLSHAYPSSCRLTQCSHLAAIAGTSLSSSSSSQRQT